MQVSFKTIKALSTPTRVRLLAAVADDPGTPTQLSDRLDLAKSTVADHLSVLVDAGLVEKDAAEGRRRVTYRATRRAETIIKGRETEMRFSLGSMVTAAAAGITLLVPALRGRRSAEAAMGALDAAGPAAGAASPWADPALLAGAALLVVAAVSGYYAFLFHRMR